MVIAYLIIAASGLILWAAVISAFWPVKKDPQPPPPPKPNRYRGPLPPEVVRSRRRCPVDGCCIVGKHSHVDDLLRRMRGQ